MTDREDVITNYREEILETFTRFVALMHRETEFCMHCGEHILKLNKVGHCVYAEPCGCRLWQGNIPKIWMQQ